MKRKYWKQFWNYIDLLLILFAIICIVSRVVWISVVSRTFKEQVKDTNKFMNFFNLGYWQILFHAFVATTVLLAWFKVGKNLCVSIFCAFQRKER
jgi:uncharacterized BrkB/YihY/UPF0761 family membrane protein